MNRKLIFKSLMLVVIFSLFIGSFWKSEQGIEGIWLGTLKIQTVELKLVFHISLTEQGTYEGTMDSPDQGAKGLRIDIVEFQDNTLVIEMKKENIRYEASLAENGDKFVGRFKQGGYDLPLELKRVEEVPRVVRPQDPKKPYPYLEEEVSYLNSRDCRTSGR